MKEHRKQMHFSKAALEMLLDYPWPGNIRELQNMMERIVLICPDGEITPQGLNHVLPFNYQKMYMPPEPAPAPTAAVEPAPAAAAPQSRESEQHTPPKLTKASLKEMEKESIIQALIDNRGIQTKAAAQLGMTARQIGYKVRKYGIEL